MKRLCNQHGYETKAFNACPFYDEGNKFIVLDKICPIRRYTQIVKQRKHQDEKYEYKIKVAKSKRKRNQL